MIFNFSEEKRVYYWVNGGIKTDKGLTDVIYDTYCVDDSYTTASPSARYGKFTVMGNWKHVPVDKFPPEFRAALLLMGIST